MDEAFVEMLSEDMNGRGLPPGFRFYPTDEELVTFYLAAKVFNGGFVGVDMVEIDLNRCEPWELPDAAKLGEREWYFYSLRDRKYPTGVRTNRATESGYWKATGKDREVYGHGGLLVGMKKTLVFYKGRAPRGEKTKWILHEYRLESDFSQCLAGMVIFLSLSLHISLSPSLYVYLSRSPYLSLSISLCLSLSLSISLCLSLSLSISLSPSLYLSLLLSISLSLHLSMSISLALHISLSISLSLSLALHISLSPSLYLYFPLSISLSLSHYISISGSLSLSLTLSPTLYLCLSILSLSIYLSICLPFILF
ncbi:uncharacterized protein LOC144713351 isoform X1 [Wolffia australiana]